MCKSTLTTAIALLFAGLMVSNAGAQSVQDARVMWSAFQCATFAEMSGDTKEQERLFTIGLKAGRQFVEALQNRQISPEAVNSEAPMIVIMLLAGPSVDFIIGRIFESAMNDAFDDVVKRKNGMELPVADWVMDKELKKSIAKQKHHQGNCELIR
jgi:hypothetical protein